MVFDSDGYLRLTDFGIARNWTPDNANETSGTPGYMAPEQFRGKSNCATDLYTLGTTLIFLLTRQYPSELPQKNLKIQFQNSLDFEISNHFYIDNWQLYNPLDDLINGSFSFMNFGAQNLMAVSLRKVNLKFVRKGTNVWEWLCILLDPILLLLIVFMASLTSSKF